MYQIIFSIYILVFQHVNWIGKLNPSFVLFSFCHFSGSKLFCHETLNVNLSSTHRKRTSKRERKKFIARIYYHYVVSYLFCQTNFYLMIFENLKFESSLDQYLSDNFVPVQWPTYLIEKYQVLTFRLETHFSIILKTYFTTSTKHKL